MATEMDMELAERQRFISENQKLIAKDNHQTATEISRLLDEVKRENERNRSAALEIAKKNASVKSASRMSGDAKAFLVGFLAAAVAFSVIVLSIAHNVRQGDAEKDQMIQTCINQGGQWRSLGGNDDANKYDEVCARR